MGAYRSDTAGATWETYVDFPTIQGTYGWYLSIVGIDPANPDIVFMGGVTLVRSGDEDLAHRHTSTCRHARYRLGRSRPRRGG